MKWMPNAYTVHSQNVVYERVQQQQNIQTVEKCDRELL